MDEKYKNYIEHKDLARAMEAIFSNSQEWDWFTEIIEADFDLSDINCWQEYLNKQKILAQIYRLLIKIRRIYKGELKTTSPLLADIIQIVGFYNGEADRETCSNRMQTQFGKISLFVIWLTTLENLDNSTDYLFNFGFLTKKNYCSLVECKTILENQEEIEAYQKDIKISGWETPAACLTDNLNRVEYSYSADFFERYASELYDANAFRFQHFQFDETLTWEETYLLEMVGTSISADKELTPILRGPEGDYPDISQWSKDRITHMLAFFNHAVASFVLETIQYILFNKVPSKETILSHCELLSDYMLKQPNNFNLCSSYQILSTLFKEKNIRDMGGEPRYRQLINQVQNCTDPQIIQILMDSAFPVSKDQREKVKQLAEVEYKAVGNITTSWDFVTYIEKPEVQNHITIEYLEATAKKFRELLPQNISYLPNLFYKYMCFLFGVKERNPGINIFELQGEMIRIQHLWQDTYFDQCVAGMHEFTYEQVLPRCEIERLQTAVMQNPYYAAVSSTIVTEKDFCDAMVQISESPLSVLVTRMNIGRLYPMPEKVIYEKHDIEKLLLEYTKKILETKGYLFLNRLDPENYVHEILIQMQHKVKLLSAMLKPEDLYERVNDIQDKNIELIDYSIPLKLAHVTQLFPLLELRIRELAEMTGFFPFKEKTKENFMQYKDPSSILIDIIKEIYTETASFEIIPDIMFVYYFMYNGNSLNIRNECIHGREFYTQEELPFALSITCLSILLIEHRIQSFIENETKKS